MSDEDDFFKALEEEDDIQFTFDFGDTTRADDTGLEFDKGRLGRPDPERELLAFFNRPVYTDGRPNKVGDCFTINNGWYKGKTFRCVDIRPHHMYQYTCVWREMPGTLEQGDPNLTFLGDISFDAYSAMDALRPYKPRRVRPMDLYVHDSLEAYQERARQKGPEGNKAK